MKRSSLLLLGIAIYLLGWSGQVSFAAPQVTGNVSLGSSYYEYIDKLEGMGYISSMPMGAKPYSRLSMAKWTIEARKAALQKPMPKYLAAYLQELETGLAPEIATIEGKGTPDSFRLTEVKTGLAYLNADQMNYGYSNGIAATWQPLNENNNGYRYGKNLNLYAGVELSGRIGHDTVLTLRPRVSYNADQSGTASLEEGYIKTRMGIVGLEVGKEALSWGQGATGSLILGDNATPRTMLKMNFLEPYKSNGFFKFLGEQNYTVFYSQMEGNRSDIADNNGRTDYNNASLIGIRTDYKPFKNFTFGMSRVSILGGDNHGLSGSDWWHWVSGTNANTAGADRWDDIAGADFRYRFPGMQLYGEVYGEDQSGFLPSDVAERIGIYFPQLVSDGSWDMRLEYVHTKSGWYAHSAYQNGWTYHHDIMGDSMGPDAQKLYMGIERHLSNVEKIGFHAMRIDMQRSSSVTQKVSELWVNYERKLHGNMYLNTMAGIAFIDNADYVNGRNDKSKFVMGEVKWKL